MNKITLSEKPNADTIISELRQLILQSKSQAVQSVNSILTLMYWEIGNKINIEVMQQQRAEYGQQIVVTVSRQLQADRQ